MGDGLRRRAHVPFAGLSLLIPEIAFRDQRGLAGYALSISSLAVLIDWMRSAACTVAGASCSTR